MIGHSRLTRNTSGLSIDAAEFHVTTAIAVLMTLRAVGGVVLDLRIQVEDLGIGAAGLADRHVLGLAAAAPPVLLVVERDPRAIVADLGAVLLRTEFHLIGRNPCRGEQLGPDGR